MILPIVAYGSKVLKTKAAEVDLNDPMLNPLIADLWDTMYGAHGVGLAAPQVGKSLRLFVVDASPFGEDEELDSKEAVFLKEFKQVFVNPTVLEETGAMWDFTEGCLSIPNIREDVSRKEQLTIHFWDKDLKEQTLTFSGLAARVVQHEYDHLEGILFTDKLSPFKKRLLKGKLTAISKGNISPEYKMRFATTKKKR